MNYTLPDLNIEKTLLARLIFVGVYFIHGVQVAPILVIGWMLADAVGWMATNILSCIFIRWLEYNEKNGKSFPINTKYMVRASPFNLDMLTYNRVYCFRLFIGWIIFAFELFAIVYMERVYLAVFVPYVITTVIYFRSVITNVNWPVSFIARFYIHYQDKLRIGQLVMYTKIVGEIVSIDPLEVIARKRNGEKIDNKLLTIPFRKDVLINGEFISIPNYVFLSPQNISYRYPYHIDYNSKV